jgi:hypothetical protein
VSTTTTIPGPTPDDLAAAVCAAQPAAGAPVNLADPEIAELSGLVSLPSGLWAHNDSGDGARVFRLADDGSTLATVELVGVEALDWEDLTGLSVDDGETLIVGDIGDNQGVRPEIRIHEFDVPDPAPTGEVTIPANQIATTVLRYPDGARDAEAIVLDPRNAELVVIHKRFGGASEVYRASAEDAADGEAELVRQGIVEVGDSPVDATTAADLGFDGRVVALRTYAAILVFPRHEDQTVAEALVENEPCDAPAAIEAQGEALAFTPDGYVTIGEGALPTVNRFTVTVPE